MSFNKVSLLVVMWTRFDLIVSRLSSACFRKSWHRSKSFRERNTRAYASVSSNIYLANCAISASSTSPDSNMTRLKYRRFFGSSMASWAPFVDLSVSSLSSYDYDYVDFVSVCLALFIRSSMKNVLNPATGSINLMIDEICFSLCSSICSL